MADPEDLTAVDHTNKAMLQHFSAHLEKGSLPMKIAANKKLGEERKKI